MPNIHFELVTPERLVREGDAWMVTVPGSEGDFGVLAGHAPLITTLRKGEIRIQASEGATAEAVKVEGGFAEVNERGLTILAEQSDGVA